MRGRASTLPALVVVAAAPHLTGSWCQDRTVAAAELPWIATALLANAACKAQPELGATLRFDGALAVLEVPALQATGDPRVQQIIRLGASDGAFGEELAARAPDGPHAVLRVILDAAASIGGAQAAGPNGDSPHPERSSAQRRALAMRFRQHSVTCSLRSTVDRSTADAAR